MICLTIPPREATEPSELFYSCGCIMRGYEKYENRKARHVCKMHREMPINPDPLEGNTPWS